MKLKQQGMSQANTIARLQEKVERAKGREKQQQPSSVQDLELKDIFA